MAGESAQERARRARDKAGRLEEFAAQCEAGSEGEAATASLLDQLPPGWSAVHDVRWPGRQRANLDHVVVGPGGIFVIDSKNWSGGVTVTGGVLRQNGHRREREVASAADAALAVAELVPTYHEAVLAVMCFTGAARVVGRVGDVALLHLENLGRFLLTRPVVLDPQQVADARARLGAALVPASRPQPSGPATRTTARPASRPTSTSRPTGPSRSRPARRSREGRRLLVGLVAAVAMITLGPAVARSVGSEAARVVVPASHGSSCGTAAHADRHTAATSPAKRARTTGAPTRSGSCS